MIRHGTALGLALGLALGVAVLAGHADLMAAPTFAVDPDLRAAVPSAPALDLGAKRSDITKVPVVRSGNPLWAIPLSSLTATRERPLFTASRRPPAPPVVARPVVQVRAPSPPPAPRQPERPRLSLVGTVGGEEGIAVFVDQTNQAIIRLRTGEGHAGWVLRTVGGREVTLQNDNDTAILALPTPEGR
jgi:general secretion pathway protein N